MSATASRRIEAPLSWREICEQAAHGRFDGFHVDTDEWGRILMTPVGWTHGARAAQIVALLGELAPDGRTVVEVGIRTRKGVKAPDVMWMSAARLPLRTEEYDDPAAGDICVEVLSPSNDPREIDEKRALYFEQGAREVWVCELDGSLRFWRSSTQELPSSGVVSAMPLKIDV